MDDLQKPGVLAGLRVVDFGQYLPGPLTAMFLADYGADVIHVDPPGGARCDHAMNAILHRNKHIVELDLKSPEGQAAARALVAGADVVIENFRPGVMARLGLDPQQCMASNPRLIWCSIPGFAASDHRAGLPGWDGVVAAAAGLHAPPGFNRDAPPAFSAIPLPSNFAAFLAAHRILAGVIARARFGVGQRIEVSLFEAAFHALGFFLEAPISREMAVTLANRVYKLLGIHRASEGSWLYIDTPVRGLQRFLDQHLPGNDLLTLSDVEIEALKVQLDALLQERPAAEWERIFQEQAGASVAPSFSTSQWLADAHALASGTVVEVDDAVLGATRQAGFPVRLSETPGSIRWGRGRAARAGEWLDAPWTDPYVPLTAAALPLDGIRVLDCTTLLAGPTATRILAQYGAEVIKIDRTGLATGEIDPRGDEEFAMVGARTVLAGKRMAFVDLQHPDGRAILDAVAAKMDIVHHNFTPDAAHRLGVASEQLAALNPGIIVTQMSLHTHGGFRAGYRGHDMLAQMITGMTERLGGGTKPRLANTVLNDNAAGHLHAFGIMLALLHRWRTGAGQQVNSSLSSTATMHQIPFMIDHDGHVADEPAGPAARGWSAMQRLYQAADGWFYLGGRGADRACLAGSPLLQGVDAVPDAMLADWLEARFRTLPLDRWVEALTALGLGVHEHISLNALLRDPEVEAQGLVGVLDHPGIGPALGLALPAYRSDGSRSPELLAQRRPGMDTLDLLEAFGFGNRLAELLRARVVATGEGPLLVTTNNAGFWVRSPRKQPFSVLDFTDDLKARVRGERQAALPLRSNDRA